MVVVTVLTELDFFFNFNQIRDFRRKTECPSDLLRLIQFEKPREETTLKKSVENILERSKPHIFKVL